MKLLNAEAVVIVTLELSPQEAQEFVAKYGEKAKPVKARKWSPAAKKRAAQKRLARKMQDPKKVLAGWVDGGKIPPGPDGKPFKRRGRPPKVKA